MLVLVWLVRPGGLSALLISVYDGKEDADRFEESCRSSGTDTKTQKSNT